MHASPALSSTVARRLAGVALLGAALLGACAAGLLSVADIHGPLAPPARLVAEPNPAAVAFHAERHARFRRTVAALAAAQKPEEPEEPAGRRADGEEGTA